MIYFELNSFTDIFIYSKKYHILRKLTKKNKEMNLSELFQEIKNGSLSKVRDIVSNEPNIVNEYYYGVTPLMYSIECEKEDIALELSQNPKIDFSLKDNLESSPLEKAIEYKMYKIIAIISKKIKKSVLNEALINEVETYLTSSIKADHTASSVSLINGIHLM